MKITFLGTTSMVPTKERNAFSILISYENENILIDCGEGTQRQLKIAGISPTKITKILISHWHGDHILGIPGLLLTLASSNYTRTLDIYGPEKSALYLKNMMSMFINKNKLKINVNEVKNGVIFENNLFKIECIELDHTAKCLAYSIIEKDKRKINLGYLKKFGLTKHPLLGKLQKGKTIKYNKKIISPKKATILKKGKKITIITDTKLCKQCFKIAKNSDLLICESTFSDELKEKAKEYKHLTSSQAALIAKKSKSKKLILTHFSQRYKEVNQIEKEARAIFKNSDLSKDFLYLEV